MQVEHYQLLEKLIAAKKTDKLLSYNTNLTTLKFGKWNILDLWKQFKHVQIGASLDGIGKPFELLRKNAEWEIVKNNLLQIKKEIKNSVINLFPTVGALNSFHITDLLKEMFELGILTEPKNIEINYLFDPGYLNISILNSQERSDLKKHYAEFLKEIKTQMNSALYLHLEKELLGLLNYLDKNDMIHLRQDFRRFTFKMDQLRKEKTVLLFPELFNLLYEE